MRAPFPPLVAGGDHLQAWPESPDALRTRMAALYGVRPEQLLPTRGATHALELVLRRLARDGVTRVDAPADELTQRVLQVAGVLGGRLAEGAGARVVASPAADGSGPLSPGAVESTAAEMSPAVLVIDESLADFEDAPSLAALAVQSDNIAVLRSLSFSHGLAGARCGAVIAGAGLIARLEEVLEPFALPTPTLRAAEAALSPSRQLATESRLAALREERARVLDALRGQPQVTDARGVGPFVLVEATDPEAARTELSRLGVETEAAGEGTAAFRVLLGRPEINDRLLAAFGAAPEPRAARRAEVVRDTKETQIAVLVDLDQAGKVKVETGHGFFDHMLEQVAVHGGFSLQLGCAGDLHIDPHHVVEDCALALGAALDRALGDRRGIGRFGFTLPMDETEARISIDLGGRPYAVFEGEFGAALLGDYPTQMTPHVFRSLSETLRAAIHVEVRGDNDHHKTEACFKAFGRALRQAIRVEGSEMPSSKGVL